MIAKIAGEKIMDQTNHLKPKYDNLSLVFLSLFVGLSAFLLLNLTLDVIINFSLILILFFVDLIFGTLFAAHQSDRKSQWREEHPN